MVEKVLVAQELGIKTLMIRRPPADCLLTVSTPEAAVRACQDLLQGTPTEHIEVFDNRVLLSALKVGRMTAPNEDSPVFCMPQGTPYKNFWTALNVPWQKPVLWTLPCRTCGPPLLATW